MAPYKSQVRQRDVTLFTQYDDSGETTLGIKMKLRKSVIFVILLLVVINGTSRHHFQQKRRLKFKCVATIYDVYHKVNEISVERIRRKQQRGPTGSNQSSKWRAGFISFKSNKFLHECYCHVVGTTDWQSGGGDHFEPTSYLFNSHSKHKVIFFLHYSSFFVTQLLHESRL